MTTGRKAGEEAGAATIARHGKLSRHGFTGSILKLVGAALVVILVSAGVVAGLAVWSLASQVRPGVELVGENEIPEIGAIEGGVNVLLAGNDSGEGKEKYGSRDESLNDVTLLLHISEDHSRATVVSFPRDLFVPIPACPHEDGGTYEPVEAAKINTTLTRGGLACTVLTVEELTGLSIPFAAMIEFDGVIEMSNAVDGVTVCVATTINDRQLDFHLEAGEHKLSGWNALQFIRTRYGIGDGSDLTRISNQQVFLSSLVRKVKSAETLSNPAKVFRLASAAVKNMELSNSLQSVNTLASIAVTLKDIDLDDVAFLQYPGELGFVGWQEGVLPNTQDAEILFDALADDVPIGLTGGTGGGATDPDAPEGETPAETPTPSPAPETPEGEPGMVALPESIKGQTANTQTCSKGQ